MEKEEKMKEEGKRRFFSAKKIYIRILSPIHDIRPRSVLIDVESQSITFIHSAHPCRFRRRRQSLASNRTASLSFDIVLSRVSLPT